MRKKLTIILLVLMAILVAAFGLAEESAADRTISFEENGYIIYVGRQLKLNAAVENILETAPKQTQLVWTSSDQDVAAVNAGGMVNGKKAGKATITAAAKDNESISASVEVEVRVPVQSVQINEKNVSVVVGGKEEAAKAQLSVAIKPEDAFFQTGTWSSSNESVATVDSNGVVTGVSAGNASITFTSDDPNGQKKAQTNIRVGQAVTAINIPKAQTIDKKKTVQIKAEVLPKEATQKKLEYTSSNPNVAKVANNGSVTALSCGKATITCKATDGSDISATCDITVIQPVTRVSSKVNKMVLFVGQSNSWPAIVEPTDATNKILAYKSEDSSIASIDNMGKVTAKSKGKTRVTASSTDGSNRSVNCNVIVEPSIPISLESIGYGIFNYNLLGITVKNNCSSMTIVDFDFDLSFYSYTGSLVNGGSYSLGSKVKIGPGKKKTIKRTVYGTGQAYKTVMTITGVEFSDGTYWSIPAHLQETWSFTRQ